MNKNRNMLIMIGIVALVCGQLHGLNPRQLTQLRNLEKKLKTRFASGIRGIQVFPDDTPTNNWLKENKDIIEKIRRLDRPSAAKYRYQYNQRIPPTKHTLAPTSGIHDTSYSSH